MNYTNSTTHHGLQSLLTGTVSVFSSHTYSPTPLISSTTEYYDYTWDTAEMDKSMACNYTRHSASFLPALYSIYFVLGLLGNGLVVWVISSGVRLRSMTDVCLLNLALADLLLVCSLPFLAHQARDQWVFGDALCKLVLGVYYVGYYSGIYFIALMGVDRYLAVVHAVYALRVRTRSYGILASAVVWVAAVLSSFPEVLVLKLSNINATGKFFCDRDYEGNASLRAGGIFKMNVLGFMVPLAMLTFCYSRILLTLLHSRSAKRQAVRLVMAVMVAFLFCWTPYNVSAFLWGLHVSGYLHDCAASNALLLSLQVTEVLAYAHCCLNPLLYVFVGEKFRRHLLRLLSRSPCLRCVRCGALKDYLATASGSVYSVSRNTSLDERSTAI
ncbi:C-C chemokine receptor type 4 [Sardina pilchardus]|uniref:C-C chemokine receptor type 4 n=1 Tax=Sardina pilchardus TaxID=27697 RepID=UPI002E15ED1A